MSGKNELTLPLAIMTSADTDAATRALLAKNDNFGMNLGQVIVLKQEKVPCFADGSGRLAVQRKENGAPRLTTKPHGHGDVHSLLQSSGLAQRWLAEGRRWLLFFQDTNALVFRCLLGALGVSSSRGFAVNSMTVPRRAGDAVGAIVRLVKREEEGGGKDGGSLTINVEYNQLDPLLRASSGFSGGDQNGSNGLSPFPGNMNQLVVDLAAYLPALEATGGAVPEFINPKYTDASKSAFKSPARLESMMQV